MKSLVFTLLAFLVTWQTAQAEVSMPKFFSDNMVCNGNVRFAYGAGP